MEKIKKLIASPQLLLKEIDELKCKWYYLAVVWLIISILFTPRTLSFLKIFSGNLLGYILAIPYILITALLLFILILRHEVGMTILSILCVGSARLTLIFFLGCNNFIGTMIACGLWFMSFIAVLYWNEL